MKKFPDYSKTARECAEEWSISQRRVQIYCAEGRIEGAFKYGQMWLIPRDTQKPPEKERKKEKDKYIHGTINHTRSGL